MIARLWRTGLRPDRTAAYEKFAKEVSLPMFRQQEGYLGCIMGRTTDEGLVLTLWRDQNSVEALDRSPTYTDTVRRILQSELLTDFQSTIITDTHLADLGGLSDITVLEKPSKQDRMED